VLVRLALELAAERQYVPQALRELQASLPLEARRLRDAQALAERQPAVAC
jgi:hypothetical protein